LGAYPLFLVSKKKRQKEEKSLAGFSGISRSRQSEIYHAQRTPQAETVSKHFFLPRLLVCANSIAVSSRNSGSDMSEKY
jgi:hypothetical protein